MQDITYIIAEPDLNEILAQALRAWTKAKGGISPLITTSNLLEELWHGAYGEYKLLHTLNPRALATRIGRLARSGLLLKAGITCYKSKDNSPWYGFRTSDPEPDEIELIDRMRMQGYAAFKDTSGHIEWAKRIGPSFNPPTPYQRGSTRRHIEENRQESG